MNWDNLCLFLAITVPLFFIARHLLLRPIERRLEVALDEHLAKTIARKLYHEIYPQSPTQPHYYADNERRERILNRSIEAFKVLLHATKEKKHHG